MSFTRPRRAADLLAGAPLGEVQLVHRAVEKRIQRLVVRYPTHSTEMRVGIAHEVRVIVMVLEVHHRDAILGAQRTSMVSRIRSWSPARASL